MTDAELMAMEKITAKTAAEYLGIGEQSCRVLARSGKIGEAVPGSNRVIFQSRKLINYKHGGPDPEEESRVLVKALEELGLPQMWAKMCLLMKELYEETEKGVRT